MAENNAGREERPETGSEEEISSRDYFTDSEGTVGEVQGTEEERIALAIEGKGEFLSEELKKLLREIEVVQGLRAGALGEEIEARLRGVTEPSVEKLSPGSSGRWQTAACVCRLLDSRLRRSSRGCSETTKPGARYRAKVGRRRRHQTPGWSPEVEEKPTAQPKRPCRFAWEACDWKGTTRVRGSRRKKGPDLPRVPEREDTPRVHPQGRTESRG